MCLFGSPIFCLCPYDPRVSALYHPGLEPSSNPFLPTDPIGDRVVSYPSNAAAVAVAFSASCLLFSYIPACKIQIPHEMTRVPAATAPTTSFSQGPIHLKVLRICVSPFRPIYPDLSPCSNHRQQANNVCDPSFSISFRFFFRFFFRIPFGHFCIFAFCAPNQRVTSNMLRRFLHLFSSPHHRQTHIHSNANLLGPGHRVAGFCWPADRGTPNAHMHLGAQNSRPSSILSVPYVSLLLTSTVFPAYGCSYFFPSTAGGTTKGCNNTRSSKSHNIL